MKDESDRELLVLAAKAAGIKAQYSENMGDFATGEPYSGNEVRWNPLTDDGDALRLAVKLELPIEFHTDGAVVYPGSISEIFSWCEDGSMAARLAIVRAAAEIGKQL